MTVTTAISECHQDGGADVAAARPAECERPVIVASWHCQLDLNHQASHTRYKFTRTCTCAARCVRKKDGKTDCGLSAHSVTGRLQADGNVHLSVVGVVPEIQCSAPLSIYKSLHRLHAAFALSTALQAPWRVSEKMLQCMHAVNHTVTLPMAL